MARIALIGPGAIGGAAAGALLARGGHELTVCAKQPFSTLTLTRADTKETQSFPVRVLTSAADAEPVEWVLLAVKSHQTASATDWLKATVGPNTRFAVLQNGVEHRARAAPFVPAGTELVPVVVQLPAERTGPGAITLYGRSNLIVPDDAAGREFSGLFADSFMKVSLTGDFMTQQWEKLCMNTASGAISALTLRTDAFANVPGMKELAKNVIEECMTVGRAEGARFAPDLADRLAGFFSQPSYRGNSMYYDRRDGKELEYDARNAVICRLGRKHGIPTPLSDALVPLLRALGPAG